MQIRRRSGTGDGRDCFKTPFGERIHSSPTPLIVDIRFTDLPGLIRRYRSGSEFDDPLNCLSASYF